MTKGANVEKNGESIGKIEETIGEIGETDVLNGLNTDLNAENSIESAGSIINAGYGINMMVETELLATTIVLANFMPSDITIGMVNTGALPNAKPWLSPP